MQITPDTIMAIECSAQSCVFMKAARSFLVKDRILAQSRLQTGFSLIELMIAITIGMIILLAISVLFSQVSIGFRSTDDGARAMENGSFGLRVIGEDMRMAGFVGMTSDISKISPLNSYTIANNCSSTDAGWPFDIAKSIEFFAPGALGALSACLTSGSFDSNSSAIVVRHATGQAVPKANLVNNNGFFIQSGLVGGLIFKGSDYATSVFGAGLYAKICGPTPAVTDPPTPSCQNSAAIEAPIFGYVANVYYIRPCSRVSGTTCPDNDAGPTLVKLQIDNAATPSFVETPIAEGVERLAVVFFKADGTSTTDPAVAMTARISLLLRSRMAAVYNDASNTYTLADATTFNCTANGASCQHRRFLYNDTVVLKNFDIRQ